VKTSEIISEVRIPHFLSDVRQLELLFLGIGLPVRSRAGFNAGGPENVSLEIMCIVGLVSGVAVDHHHREKPTVMEPQVVR